MGERDDTDRPTNGWTNRSIYELLLEIDKRYAMEFQAVRASIEAADKRYEQRFAAQEKAVDSALVEREKAVIKAEIASEKRFDALAETFTEKIDSLVTARDKTAGGSQAIANIMSTIAILISALVGLAILTGKAHY